MAIKLKNFLLYAEQNGNIIINHSSGESPTIIPFRNRSLDYGDNAPLITKALPGVLEDTESNARELTDALTEGFIPGGALTAGERAITDTKRIGKFLLTKEGISFLATEVAGQRMNPQSLISPTNRTRTPLNLLAQIPSNIAGLHFRRDGLLDRDIENNYNYDPNRYNPNAGGNTEGGFLSSVIDAVANATQGKKYETELREIVRVGAEDTYDSTLLGLYSNLQAGQDESLIREYSGGADSTFGIGTTRIKKYAPSPYATHIPRPRQEDLKKEENKEKEKIRTQYQTGDPSISPSPDGTYTYNSPTVDRVNVADVFKRTSFVENTEEAEKLKDFIKFKIALIDTENPLNDEVLIFRAFLEGLNDNFTGNWNPYKYNGRAENFYVYNGFDRSINFNFKVAPQSQIELKPLYRKLNYLVSSTAPEYVNRRMRGRYVRLTIGDWCYEVPGFFSNIGLSWTNSYPWETNPLDEDYISQHPLILNVACNFKPIHDFTPESKIDKPFIIRTRDMVKPYSQYPNNPPSIASIPPPQNNIPPPELQQQAQTNLNNAVDGISAHDITHKRINYGNVIDFGYVNEVPDFSRDPNSISTVLGNFSNVKTIQAPNQSTPPTERQYTVEEQINQKIISAERSKFGVFM